jgi:hypothetical protein
LPIKRVREDEAPPVLPHGKQSRQNNRLLRKWHDAANPPPLTQAGRAATLG